MKTIFSHSKINKKGEQYYKMILAIDENKDQVKELKKIKKLIDLYLYYKLDKIVTIGDVK